MTPLLNFAGYYRQTTWRFALSSTSARQVVAETYRAEWGRLLSLLVARTRRLDLCEDALSEAFARAASRWPTAGVPNNPSGWVYTTAYRLVLGGLRAQAISGRQSRLLAVAANWVEPTEVDPSADLGDERLAIILLCANPALSPEARSGLALRLVIGTTTEEIARLFLVSRTTMQARITRAKKKIVTAGIPLSSPANEELHRRLVDVCRTIYLAFTAGYSPGSGPDLLRPDLAGEAVNLAAVLHQLVPEAPQSRALYGLVLLQHARRDAREHDGNLVTLAEQDRSLWHKDELAKGMKLIANLPESDGYVEELRLQGLIATKHAQAANATETDWPTIAALYGQLETLTKSPIVRLNRAVALGEATSPNAGLELLDGLDKLLTHNHRLHAVRADLARRAGKTSLAKQAYEAALQTCQNDVERQYLQAQLEAQKRSKRRN